MTHSSSFASASDAAEHFTSIGFEVAEVAPGSLIREPWQTKAFVKGPSWALRFTWANSGLAVRRENVLAIAVDNPFAASGKSIEEIAAELLPFNETLTIRSHKDTVFVYELPYAWRCSHAQMGQAQGRAFSTTLLSNESEGIMVPIATSLNRLSFANDIREPREPSAKLIDKLRSFGIITHRIAL